MKKLLIVTCLLAIMGIFCVGCPGVVTPVFGAIYTDARAGVAFAQNGTPTKTGEACAQAVLGIVATGDASIEAAMKNGGITRVLYVDSYSSHIVVISKYCTIVHGN